MKLNRMKVLRNVLLFLPLLLPLLGSTPRPHGDIKIPEISERINAFTMDFLKRVAADNAEKNTVLSPQSIFRGLAMSYVAAGGQTRRELAQVLHFPDDNDKLLKQLSELDRRFAVAAKHQKIDVSIANSVWLDEANAKFRKEYVATVEKTFAASLHSARSRESGQMTRKINDWISEKTRGRIKGSVSPEDFKSRSRPGVIDEPALVTVNTVYFKADWGSRFDKKSTSEKPFHVDAETTVDALSMHQRSLLPYSEDENFKFLEIPYIKGYYSMYILLPKQILTVNELVSAVDNQTIIGLKRTAFEREVDVLLPKFEFGNHRAISNVLSDMGVNSAFDSEEADFDRMIVKRIEAYRIYLSEVYHNAWIEVNEEGTEAAAATTGVHFSFGCSASVRPPRVDFHADHPFLFLIVDNKSRSVLFAGWIVNPAKAAGQPAQRQR
ncbi:MAG: serpin family protein [Planctomycetes bacterium]|nr:serpin family protein [Planctomycetota bacterium]